jgi:hypothetical protein
MRIAVRIVAGLAILCSPVGVAVLSSDSNGEGVSLVGLAGIGFILMGVVAAVGSTMLGLVASALGRQFAWLGTLLFVALLPFIGIPVVIALAGQVSGQFNPVTGPQPRTAFDLFIVGLPGTAFDLFIVWGPVLVGFVAFIYSFRLRDPAAVVAAPTATAPRK